MALSLIVFDCDGVLLESMDVKCAAFRRIGEQFGEEMADRLVMYHRMHGGISRYKKFEWMYEELGTKATDADLSALNEIFVAAAYEEMKRCPIVPGAKKTLEAWFGRVPLFVASGAPEEELRTILEKRGLSPYFTGIFGSPASKTRILRAIVEHNNAHPGDVVMVGDSHIDLCAAKEVGTRFYGRGAYFKHSGHPWHDDLAELDAYLEGVAAERYGICAAKYRFAARKPRL